MTRNSRVGRRAKKTKKHDRTRLRCLVRTFVRRCFGGVSCPIHVSRPPRDGRFARFRYQRRRKRASDTNDKKTVPYAIVNWRRSPFRMYVGVRVYRTISQMARTSYPGPLSGWMGGWTFRTTIGPLLRIVLQFVNRTNRRPSNWRHLPRRRDTRVATILVGRLQ